MMNRTYNGNNRSDVHRPLDFNPTDYVAIKFWDTEPPYPIIPDTGGFLPASYNLAVAWYHEQVAAVRAEFGGEIPGNCDHCGAHVRYCWSVKHLPTGKTLCMGDDCVHHRLGITRDEFRIKELKKITEAAASNAKRIVELAEWAAKNADVVTFLTGREQDRFNFYQEMARQMQSRALSQGQTAAIRRLMARQDEFDAREREYVARKKAEADALAAAPLAPEGAQTVRGKILNVKIAETDFGRQFKMLVQVQDGNKVYGTAPAGLWNTSDEYEQMRGAEIEFTATFTRKEEHFSFFSRPRKARRI